MENTRFWSSIEPSLSQLKSIETLPNPFLVISLVGQHILTLDYFLESSILLDCCLKIDTESLKLKSSIYSSIAVSYWKLANSNNQLENTNLALDAMKNDLNCVIKLNDLNGQYRALTNLGAAFYQLKQFNEALENYSAQLDVARMLDNRTKIIGTLKLIANVHQQLKDYRAAIASYEELLNLARQEDDLNLILKCSKTLSALFAQSNDLRKSIDYQEQVCRLVENVTKFEKLKPKAYLELGDLCERVGDHQKSVEISQNLLNSTNDRNLKLLIYEKLANNELKVSNFSDAKNWLEKQLILTDLNENKEIKLNCLANLASVNFKLNNYQLSIDLNGQLLNQLDDETADGKERKIAVLNSLGECFYNLNNYQKAMKYFKDQLKLDNDQSRTIERKPDRLDAMKKLSVCYKKTNQLDDMLKLYFDVLNYAKQIDDLDAQLWSFYNIGLLYSTNGAYEQAISIFDEYLTLLNDESDTTRPDERIKVYHMLALINHKMNKHNESFDYFRRDPNLMEQLKEHLHDLNINIDTLDGPINDDLVITSTKICCLLISPKGQPNPTVDDIINSFNELNL